MVDGSGERDAIRRNSAGMDMDMWMDRVKKMVPCVAFERNLLWRRALFGQ